MLYKVASFRFLLNRTPEPRLDKRTLLKTVSFLARYVPIVARGLFIGFFAAAVTTLFFGYGDYASAQDRYLVAGLFLLFGIVSLGIVYSIKPIMRRVLRWMM